MTSHDPPSPPIISGYMEGQIIPAGSVQKLLCVSSGGNPLATLTWYKNDKRVSGMMMTYEDRPSPTTTNDTFNQSDKQKEKREQENY
uniref:Ig-like domain-containing protein n=1 Tax=Glossina palpalis gambiensis TaxID=67801 RepID=A0A1B0C3X9_9MUSC